MRHSASVSLVLPKRIAESTHGHDWGDTAWTALSPGLPMCRCQYFNLPSAMSMARTAMLHGHEAAACRQHTVIGHHQTCSARHRFAVVKLLYAELKLWLRKTSDITRFPGPSGKVQT